MNCIQHLYKWNLWIYLYMKLTSCRYCIVLSLINTFFPLFPFCCFPSYFIFWLKLDVMVFLYHNNCKMLLISCVFPFLLFILLCKDPLANWWNNSREFWIWDFCNHEWIYIEQIGGWGYVIKNLPNSFW